MNPMGKVPILKDGGLVVPDSSVICAYLERAHPARPMYPDDAGGNARALFLEEYADTALNGATIWIYVERVLHDECDEARVNKILAEDLPPVLDYIEPQMPAGRDTILGEFGIADAAVIAELGSLDLSGEAIDAARWLKTAAYFAAHKDRPSVALSLQAL